MVNHLDHEFEQRTTPPKVGVPAVHLWVLGLGVSCFVVSIPLLVLCELLAKARPGLETPLRELILLLFVLAFAFTAFGVCCDVILNMAIWRVIRKNDEQRLEDLSGRTRFAWRKKKSTSAFVDHVLPAPRRSFHLGSTIPARPRPRRVDY